MTSTKEFVPCIEEANADNSLNAQEHDDCLIDAFLTDIGLVDVGYKSIIRLGKKNTAVTQPKRPIKVIMNNDHDKERIMANLKQLKGKEKYKGVSITDDHTIKERNTIKELIEKAKTANANETDDSVYEWKVRGTPKNGMRLIKMKKRTVRE